MGVSKKAGSSEWEQKPAGSSGGWPWRPPPHLAVRQGFHPGEEPWEHSTCSQPCCLVTPCFPDPSPQALKGMPGRRHCVPTTEQGRLTEC